MADKADFNKLRRGVKLLKDHVYTPIAYALSELTDKGITYGDNLEKDGTFRINYFCPCITKYHRSAPDPVGASGVPIDVGHMATMPFILPPLQEFTDAALGNNTQIRPQFTLEEVSFGFEQRNEPWQLNDYWEAGGGSAAISSEGYPGTGGHEGLGVTVNIRSKKQQPGFILAADEPNAFDNVVFSMEISNFGLTNDVLRFNPVVKSNLDVVLDPDATYLIEVASDGEASYWSSLVSLKIRHRMVQRDESPAAPADRIQNMPAHNGGWGPTNPGIVKPASDSLIAADGVSGVSTALKVVDDIVRRKLRGGYSREGNQQTAATENIKDSACYDVIAVNLFNGFWSAFGGAVQPVVGGGAATDLPYILPTGALPYLAANNSITPTMDSKIIRLHYPFVLHHVIAATNYALPGDPDGNRDATYPQRSYRPYASGLFNHVGVALHSGIRGDKIAYQQLAELNWSRIDPAVSHLILDSAQHPGGLGYMWEMTEIPLLGNAGFAYRDGTGNIQGKPIFCARGNSDNAARSNIGNGLGTAPLTDGQEQAIEIRWMFGDPLVNGMTDSARYANQATVLGLGGNWVFLYGKKQLC